METASMARCAFIAHSTSRFMQWIGISRSDIVMGLVVSFCLQLFSGCTLSALFLIESLEYYYTNMLFNKLGTENKR